ncbi:MAG: hypothetical protein LQ347_004498 [Umbilicaria vellea]|nr:MAG: hypothetical protein LQ347_004498 [Umbilicaria vellea]
MAPTSPKRTASKTSPGCKERSPKGQSKKTIAKAQATSKKDKNRAKVEKVRERTHAVASAFEENAEEAHELLVESSLFQSIETADEDATTQLLTQIYADLHEASFDGLIKYTKDLKLPLSWVPDPANTSVSGWLRHSVQSRLILHTQEMFSVIDDAYSNYELKPDRPHHRIVPTEPSVAPTRPSQDHEQKDINDVVFDPTLFYTKPRPAHWPVGLHYPVDDPTTRLVSYGACELCGNTEYANCGCHSSTHRAVTRPLVELVQIPGKGIGVRALQPIKEDAILQEYVGLLIPINADLKDQDPIYGMAFNPTPEKGFGTSIATISSKRYGNWTRFINHSCAANCFFRTMAIGRRMRVMVVASQDIRFGEEITIDYGDQYWTEDKLCRCGEPDCKYGTREAIAKNTPGGRQRRLAEIAAKEDDKKRRLEEKAVKEGDKKRRREQPAAGETDPKKRRKWW